MVKDFKKIIKKTVSDGAIEELMLAKTELEARSKSIEEKDRMIRELLRKTRVLESAQKELKNTLREANDKVEKRENEARKERIESVIIDIVHILSKYEKSWDIKGNGKRNEENALAYGILNILRDKYGLEIIDRPSGIAEPELHEVVEVIHDHDMKPHTIQLTKGYRIGKSIIKPARIKVIEGGEIRHKDKVKKENPSHNKPELTTLEGINFVV